MNKPNSVRVSGTRFLDDDASGLDRVSLSASFRGMAHVITGETRSLSTHAIDAVAGEQALAVCAPATRKLAEDLFNRWSNALKTLDARKVAECYAEDAVLLPTVSNIPRTNRDEITDYFVHFLEKKPVGSINQRTVRLAATKLPMRARIRSASSRLTVQPLMCLRAIPLFMKITVANGLFHIITPPLCPFDACHQSAEISSGTPKNPMEWVFRGAQLLTGQSNRASFDGDNTGLHHLFQAAIERFVGQT